MRNQFQHFYIAVAMVASGLHAQQSPAPATSSQPAQVQTPLKPAPCVPPKPPSPSKRVQVKPTSRWQKFIEAQRAKIEAKTGLTTPDISLNDIAKKVQAPSPCPAVNATAPTPPSASTPSGNPTTPPVPSAAPAPTNTPPPPTNPER